MVQVEMEELAMKLDFEKNYLALKKVVLLASPKMFYFTVLFWNVMFWNKTSGEVQKWKCQYKGWNAGIHSSYKPEEAQWGGVHVISSPYQTIWYVWDISCGLFLLKTFLFNICLLKSVSPRGKIPGLCTEEPQHFEC